MGAMTAQVPKALLQIRGEARGRVVLDTILDAVLCHGEREVVVVTGFGAAHVCSHVSRYDGVRCIENRRWEQDVNIGSVACGVGALAHPQRGYLVVETDLLLDDEAWNRLFEIIDSDTRSYWVCRGRYGTTRTGGVVHAGPDGQIDIVDYRPVYDATCEGWPKMLGMLAVGADEVAADIALRAAAIRDSLRQYYLMPWKHGLAKLSARVLPLEAGFAATFNTADEFETACQGYLGASQNESRLAA